MKTYSLILIVVLLTCLSLLIYWNTLSHQFVNVGDTSLIVQNPFIKSLALENIMRIFTPGTVETYQPICTLSYALDYYFWRFESDRLSFDEYRMSYCKYSACVSDGLSALSDRMVQNITDRLLLISWQPLFLPCTRFMSKLWPGSQAGARF